MLKKEYSGEENQKKRTTGNRGKKRGSNAKNLFGRKNIEYDSREKRYISYDVLSM